MPEMKSLNLPAFAELDGGKLNIAVQQAIKTVVTDINDRPNEKKPRTVRFDMSFKPKLDSETGAIDTVEFLASITTKVPDKVSATYPMLPTKDGQLTFQPGSPNDPRQGSLFGAEERQEQQADD